MDSATAAVYREISLLPLYRKNIIARLLKFVGYIHFYRICSGNIFGLILKYKMAATGVSLSVMKQCVEIFPLTPQEQKVL